MGTKLVFNGEGHVITRIPHPREVGTTVSIRALFNRFPVRRTELQSHSKREFSHALNMIQSFAIISRQVQFLQVSSSADSHPPSQPLLTLTPASSMKDALGQIFGQKTLENIISIDDHTIEEAEREFKVIRECPTCQWLPFLLSSMVIFLGLNMDQVARPLIVSICSSIIVRLTVHLCCVPSMIPIDNLIPISIPSWHWVWTYSIEVHWTSTVHQINERSSWNTYRTWPIRFARSWINSSNPVATSMSTRTRDLKKQRRAPIYPHHQPNRCESTVSRRKS